MSPMNALVATPKPSMTADEFWDFCLLPENENRSFELIRGKVVEVSRPTKKHGIVSLNVGFVLKLYVRKTRKGYVVSNDSGVLLETDPDTVVGPDIAYFTDARTFAEVHPKWGEEPPVLAVEVLLPNDKPNKVNAKVRDYLKGGVKLVWLVDFEERTVCVYRPNRNLDVLVESDVLNGGEELPGFSCPVAELFLLDGEHPVESSTSAGT